MYVIQLLLIFIYNTKNTVQQLLTHSLTQVSNIDRWKSLSTVTGIFQK